MNRKHRRAPRASLLTEYAAPRVSALMSYADTSDPAPSDEPGENTSPTRYWSGVIGMEGKPTGDGRIILAGALEWETPIPLRYVKEDVGGHLGAVTAGRILSITRDEESGEIRASGDFDLGSEEGREAARLVGERMMTGVSMDLDSVAFEVRASAEEIAEWDALDKLYEEAEEGETVRAERETAEDGSVIIDRQAPDALTMATTSARIRAATLVSIPAFAEAKISAAEELPAEVLALVASAAPVDPPAAWFSRPEADGPTALTITDEGEVYGHLATWDTCHIADPAGSGVCVMAPKSKSDYAYFHVGAVRTAEGTQIPTGVLRFNTKHASTRASADSAAAHYDHTGLAGADIHVINGKHGVWVSGALRPGLSAEQVRTLRASPLSGDWRYINGDLELVGALAVNLPGFPIPRPAGLVASGELQSLVASGMIAPAREIPGLVLSVADQAYVKRLIERDRAKLRADAEALRVRANRAIIERRAGDLARKLSNR